MISLKNVSVVYRTFQHGPVDLTVPGEEFFMLMGPTGSGKTLLLEAIAGLAPLHSGTVTVAEEDVTGNSPGRRSVGIVYQDSALFPHLTVEQNIRYGIRYMTGESRFGFDELVKLLDLQPLLGRLPEKLSGGEKQRTALARALVTDPGVILLDEPLSSLDQMFKGGIRRELKKLHRETGTTFMMTTHDFADALSLGTRGAVIREGRIEQEGTVEELFYSPGTPFMASFVGMKNVFSARFRGCCAEVRGMEIHTAAGRTGGGFIAVPPEAVVLSLQPVETSERNRFRGSVTGVEQTGSLCEVSVECGSGPRLISRITRKSLLKLGIEEGLELYVSFKASAVHVF